MTLVCSPSQQKYWSAILCMCVPPPNEEKNPYLANEETFWDYNEC